MNSYMLNIFKINLLTLHIKYTIILINIIIKVI